MSYGLVMSSPSRPVHRFSFFLAGLRFLGPEEEFLPRVLAGRGLAQVFQRLAALRADVLRHHHLDRDEQVTVGAVRSPAALTPHAERAAVRRIRRDPHRYRA